MEGAGAQQRNMRFPTLMAHVAQIVVAVAILGLAAYGVDYIKYDVLIYSVTVVSTLFPIYPLWY
jgi:hypothetical protein